MSCTSIFCYVSHLCPVHAECQITRVSSSMIQQSIMMFFSCKRRCCMSCSPLFPMYAHCCCLAARTACNLHPASQPFAHNGSQTFASLALPLLQTHCPGVKHCCKRQTSSLQSCVALRHKLTHDPGCATVLRLLISRRRAYSNLPLQPSSPKRIQGEVCRESKLHLFHRSASAMSQSTPECGAQVLQRFVQLYAG